MKLVKAYKTDDGQTFEDEGKALKHQLKIDLRGLMQSSGNTIASSRVNSATDAAEILSARSDAALEVLRQHTLKMGRYVRRTAAAMAK